MAWGYTTIDGQAYRVAVDSASVKSSGVWLDLGRDLAPPRTSLAVAGRQ